MRLVSLSLHTALFALMAVTFYTLGTDTASAQGSFVPLSPAPAGSRLGQLYSSNSLTGFVNGLFTAAIAVGAILAVMRLAFAGYLYMTTDAWGQKGKAKEVIGDVILGLLLLLSIWLILRQINPEILNLDILRNIPKTQPSGQPTGPVGSDPVPNLQPSGLPNDPLDSTFLGGA